MLFFPARLEAGILNTSGYAADEQNNRQQEKCSSMSTNPLWNLLFPHDAMCFACERPAHVNAHGLCDACANAIPLAGEAPPPEGLCGLTAAFLYVPALHAAMHRLKYGGARYLARYFAGAMVLPPAWQSAVLVPVPLHAKKHAARGYNQSDYLMRALLGRYPMQTSHTLLLRTRDTAPQAQLSAAQRATNMEQAFSASPEANGKTILLIDDVCTTGSTLSACAEALKAQGALNVYAACACRAPLE